MDRCIKLSIIIVTYNCYDYLKKAICSIEQYNDLYDEIEVIVVDNGSDGSYKKLKSNLDLKLKTIKNDNKGFGEGNNRGAEIASGNYLLFLNPDTELVEPIFKKIIGIFEKNPDIGTIGVKLINGDGKRGATYNLRFRFGFFRTLLSKIAIKFGIYLQDKMYTSGADLFIRADLFRKIGGFDEKFFLYCEESDISNRVNATGYKTFYYNKLTIIHHEGKTEACNLYKTYLRELNSWKYYCEKYSLNFNDEFKKEIRYCKFKCFLLRCLNKKEASDQYKAIIETCNNLQ